jgi:hypothetical protein
MPSRILYGELECDLDAQSRLTASLTGQPGGNHGFKTSWTVGPQQTESVSALSGEPPTQGVAYTATISATAVPCVSLFFLSTFYSSCPNTQPSAAILYLCSL